MIGHGEALKIIWGINDESIDSRSLKRHTRKELVKKKLRGKVNGTLLERKEKEENILLYILHRRKLNIAGMEKLPWARAWQTVSAGQIRPTVCFCRVVLECSRAHSFPCGCLPTAGAGWSCATEPARPAKQKIVTVWIFTENACSSQAYAQG